MTTEEIINETYPYRLPVFVLNNTEGYSQVVLNNVCIDDVRNNITYNNNALMFLRKKQFVPGINLNKKVYTDLEEISQQTNKNLQQQKLTKLINKNYLITEFNQGNTREYLNSKI